MMNSHCTALWRNEDGQDLIEYSMLLVFVAMAAMAILVTVGGSIQTLWSGMNTQLTSAAS